MNAKGFTMNALSKFKIQAGSQAGLVKVQTAKCRPSVSDSGGLGRGLRTCISQAPR